MPVLRTQKPASPACPRSSGSGDAEGLGCTLLSVQTQVLQQNKQQHILSNSPVFYVGHGADVLPLRSKWPCSGTRCGGHLPVSCVPQSVAKRSALRRYAAGMVFSPSSWEEKQSVGDKVAWHTFVGSKVRGQCASLVLQKRGFATSLSTLRPSGLSAPPPLTVAKWQGFAREHLHGRRPGLLCSCSEPAPQSRQRQPQHGGPHYTKNCTRKGVKKVGRRKSNLKTLAGTQCSDGTWTSLKLLSGSQCQVS